MTFPPNQQLDNAARDPARLNLFFDVLMFISRSPDTDTLLRGILSQLRWLLDFDRATITYDEGDSWRSTSFPLPDAGANSPAELTAEEAAIVEAVLAANISERRVGESDKETLLCLPLAIDSSAFGALLFVAQRPDAFDRTDCQYAQSASTYLSLALDRLKQTEALAHARDALERSNTDLQQFAYIASHDLQEPLRAVAGYCELLGIKLGDNANPEIQEFLGHATDGAKRMQLLIHNLLEYARIETKGNPLAPTDARATVNEAITNLSVAIAEDQADVSVPKLPTVMADRLQLVLLFQNLISNALKFRSDDPPRIKIAAEEEAGHWHFSVADNGIGIESQHAERIFDIFQRLHRRTEFPGTGLGLAISKRIVERHGGEIWMTSQGGQGSTFHFTIPKKRF